MTTENDIIQAFRTLAMSRAVPATARTDAQVIKAQPAGSEKAGPRPPLPYLTVGVITLGSTEGYDEPHQVLDDDDDPIAKQRGQRYGTVTITGYGPDTAEWLENIWLSWLLPGMQSMFHTAGLAVDTIGDGVRRVNVSRSTGVEVQFIAEFSVRYILSTSDADAVSLVEAATVQAEITHTHSPPADFSRTETVTL